MSAAKAFRFCRESIYREYKQYRKEDHKQGFARSHDGSAELVMEELLLRKMCSVKLNVWSKKGIMVRRRLERASPQFI